MYFSPETSQSSGQMTKTRGFEAVEGWISKCQIEGVIEGVSIKKTNVPRNENQPYSLSRVASFESVAICALNN